MSRSTRSTRRTASRPTRSTRSARAVRSAAVRTSTATPRATVRRNLKYFTFQYNRDDVSHAANANGVVIVDKLNSGTSVSLSLQEAKSLYDFLASQIRTR
jgi:hypothetical protein